MLQKEFREHQPVKYFASNNECNLNDVVWIYEKHLPQILYKTWVMESFIKSRDDKNPIANVR